MLAFEHDHHAGRIEVIVQGVRDLVGQALLDLQAAREHIHDARDLAQADDFLARDIGDMRLADKGQHMVLAHRRVVDIGDHDHFALAVFHVKQRAVDDRLDILPVAVEHLVVHAGDAGGRFPQTIAVRVFALMQQNQPDRFFDRGGCGQRR